MTHKEIPTERSVIVIVIHIFFFFFFSSVHPILSSHYSPIIPRSMHIDTPNPYPMHLQSLDHISTPQSYDPFIYILRLPDLLLWGFSAELDDVWGGHLLEGGTCGCAAMAFSRPLRKPVARVACHIVSHRHTDNTLTSLCL
jgi:hypothetical protein